MDLWIEWFQCVRKLRVACSRNSTFLWMAVVLATMAIRPDLLGVTSLVRAACLEPVYYYSLRNVFQSNGLDLRRLTATWVRLAMSLFMPITVDGYFVFVADGLKVAKEGKKMPAVKYLHQESADNSKPEYIMGHSFQAISLLVQSVSGQVFSVPLISRISEGIIWQKVKNPRTLLDKLASMFLDIVQAAGVPAILVVDAYYASRKIIKPLLEKNHHLISKCKINSVAYKSPPPPKQKKRGRPKLYGDKVRLRNLFKSGSSFLEAPSPVYGEKDVTIKYRTVILLWRPVGIKIQFVLVKHPTRGKVILMSTSLDIDPLTIIKLYGLRFKIEVSFKQAVHTIGTYAYHFWMKSMQPIKRCSGDQLLEKKSEHYRRKVKKKLDTYHRYIQLGCISQGLLQHLAINFRGAVWASFRSWLRTMRKDLVPSEMVVSNALKSCFPEFLMDRNHEPEIKKFILDRMAYEKFAGFRMTG